MSRFRKKPVIVEAMQWTGKNQKDIRKFCPCARFNCGKYVIVPEVFIPTLEGTMTGRRGDWIIKGIKGEFYPCKPAIFAATYELEEPEKS